MFLNRLCALKLRINSAHQCCTNLFLFSFGSIHCTNRIISSHSKRSHTFLRFHILLNTSSILDSMSSLKARIKMWFWKICIALRKNFDSVLSFLKNFLKGEDCPLDSINLSYLIFLFLLWILFLSRFRQNLNLTCSLFLKSSNYLFGFQGSICIFLLFLWFVKSHRRCFVHFYCSIKF